MTSLPALAGLHVHRTAVGVEIRRPEARPFAVACARRKRAWARGKNQNRRYSGGVFPPLQSNNRTRAASTSLKDCKRRQAHPGWTPQNTARKAAATYRAVTIGTTLSFGGTVVSSNARRA